MTVRTMKRCRIYSHLVLYCSRYTNTDAIQCLHDTKDDIYFFLQILDILHWIELTLLLLHRVTTTLKKTISAYMYAVRINLLKNFFSSSSTALTGGYESHHVLFILFDCILLKKRLHSELFLQFALG